MAECSFVDVDGLEIFYLRWVPAGDVRAIVVIIHGASEHSGRYARLAEVLLGSEYAVYALDQRGHGRTARSTGRGKIGPRGMDGLLDDVHQLVTLARIEVPGAPVIVFGHSMGSLVTQAYVQRHGDGVAGYVLSGTMGPMPNASEVAAGFRDAVASGLADEGVDTLGPFNANFEPVRTKYDWLSRDANEVDRYIADPLCGDDIPLTYGFVAEMITTIATAMEPIGVARIPKQVRVLLLTGDDDPVSDRGTGVRELEKTLRNAGLDVTARYYEGARHEVLNETNREEVHDDIVEWSTRVERSMDAER